MERRASISDGSDFRPYGRGRALVRDVDLAQAPRGTRRRQFVAGRGDLSYFSDLGSDVFLGEC
jgi:hypothetical protein